MSQICCKTVYDRSMNFPRPHGCRNTATKQHDGEWYCATHHPEAIAKRQEKSAAKFAEQIQQSMLKHKAQQERAHRLALFDELVSMLKPDLLESIILDLDTAMSESNARALSQYIADLKSVKVRAIQ